MQSKLGENISNGQETASTLPSEITALATSGNSGVSQKISLAAMMTIVSEKTGYPHGDAGTWNGHGIRSWH